MTLRSWFKVPEVALVDIAAGSTTAAEGAMLAAVAVDIHINRGITYRSAADLGRDVGLPARTAQVALYGIEPGEGDDRAGRPGLLGRYLRQEPEGLSWRPGILGMFARLSAAERDAMAARPPEDALVCWAVCKILCDGRRHCNRWTWDGPAFCAELRRIAPKRKPWLPGRARRALVGAKQRMGALGAGLLRMVDGAITAWFPRDGEPPAEPAPDLPPQVPEDTADRADPRLRVKKIPDCASTRLGSLWQISILGDGGRVLLLDLLERRAKQAQYRPDDLDSPEAPSDLAEWLETDRAWKPPGRRWAPEIIARLLPEVKRRLAAHLAKTSERAAEELSRWRRAVQQLVAQVDGETRQALNDLLRRRDPLPVIGRRVETILKDHHERRLLRMPQEQRRKILDQAEDEARRLTPGAAPEAIEDLARHIAVEQLTESSPVNPSAFWCMV